MEPEKVMAQEVRNMELVDENKLQIFGSSISLLPPTSFSLKLHSCSQRYTSAMKSIKFSL